MKEDVWSILGIEPTDDERAIKRAYAARVKITSPEADAAGYMKLREAFEQAKNYARVQQQYALEEQESFDDAEPENAPDHAADIAPGVEADAPGPETLRPAAPAATPQQLAIGGLHASLEKLELDKFLQQLEEIRAAGTFASLDDQYHFVGTVAVMVQEANLEDSAWCGRVAQLLGAREHENLFTDHPRYHYAYDYLLGRYAEMREAGAQAHAGENRDDSAAPGYVHVYQVLTAPFDAERLSALTRSQSYHRLAQRLLERAKTDPSIVIPFENREWWERTAMAGQHRPMADTIGRPAPAPEKSSGGFGYWPIGIVLFLIIHFVRMIPDNTPSHSTVNLQALEKFQKETMPMILERDLVNMSGEKYSRLILQQCDAQTRSEIIMQVYAARRTRARAMAEGTPAPAPGQQAEVDTQLVRLLAKCKETGKFDPNASIELEPRTPANGEPPSKQ